MAGLLPAQPWQEARLHAACMLPDGLEQAAGYPQVNPSDGDGYPPAPRDSCLQGGRDGAGAAQPSSAPPSLAEQGKGAVTASERREASPCSWRAKSRPCPTAPGREQTIPLPPPSPAQRSRQHPSAQTPASPQILHWCCSLQPSLPSFGGQQGNLRPKPPLYQPLSLHPASAPPAQLPALRRARAGGAHLPSLPPSMAKTRNMLGLVFVSGQTLSGCSNGKRIPFSMERKEKKIPHLCQICNTA